MANSWLLQRIINDISKRAAAISKSSTLAASNWAKKFSSLEINPWKFTVGKKFYEVVKYENININRVEGSLRVFSNIKVLFLFANNAEWCLEDEKYHFLAFFFSTSKGIVIPTSISRNFSWEGIYLRKFIRFGGMWEGVMGP